ncbi:hypothetical protein NBRC116187_32040 [Halopseudomonas sabulinigri]|uniref:Uncharacterized protein n=1 Tax=Halopseudomonas sabulinigri TaxID=472181 RepID=A0ABP9ZTS2_9GAMM
MTSRAVRRATASRVSSPTWFITMLDELSSTSITLAGAVAAAAIGPLKGVKACALPTKESPAKNASQLEG